ncbi:HxlR family transcriptional regulator [Ignicoccus islandicus DSM 13165]|uniref:HxlR family transcriptional regulator n=1 Tax=Ignicoccus islandicus DSM 13165 TaxID=940295 RepID=A0A0U3F2I0_9CREN|nr:helix-turn-helix domain-containing protein [Ignicoccus islandicus]ALU11749.1 HxlR family transcriptional regulator [Ignicoccus islandicus DSM 13165]
MKLETSGRDLGYDSNQSSQPEIVKVISECIEKLKELHENYSNKRFTPQELKDKLSEIRPKMELLTSKWVPDILYALLLSGGMGFNELKHTLGMSSRVLSDKLQELVKNGLVVKEEVDGPGTKRVKYRLTSVGKEVVFSLTPFLLGIYLAGNEGCKN